MPTTQGFPQERPEKESLGFILMALSFCLPMVGIILFFAMRKTKPDAARQAAICAAFGVFTAVILNIIYSMVMKMNL
jgi:hypothetical protein